MRGLSRFRSSRLTSSAADRICEVSATPTNNRIAYRLSVIGYRLSAIGYRLSVIGYRLSAVSIRLTRSIAACAAWNFTIGRGPMNEYVRT